jgi:O-antigen ligase
MREQRVVRAAFPALIGVAGALLAARVASLDLKYLVAFVGIVAGLAVLLALRTSARLHELLVAGLALTIPINLDVNFLFRPHIGGAPSISVSASLLCVLTLVAVWLYRHRTGEIRPLWVREPSIVWAAMLYMAAGVLSLWNAPHRDLVFLEEVRLATLFLTMLVVMNLRGQEQLRTFVLFLTVSAFVQGALATTQFVTHSSLGLRVFGAADLVKLDIGTAASRATGTIGHPNVLGYYLEMALPLGLALFLVERRTLQRMWYLAAFLATLAGLVATLSRGAWLSVPVSCGFTLWVLYRKRAFRLGSGVGLSLIGAVAIVFLYFAYPTIERRFLHDDYSSAAARMPLNRATLSIIGQYPVVGVGLNNFAEVFHAYDTTGYSRIFTKRSATGQAISSKPYKHVVHNLVLWVWAEIGTLGLLAFIWLFAAAFRLAWRASRGADDWSRAVLVACVAGMLGHLVHAQVDPGFRISPAVSMLLYAMFGLIGAISLQQRREPAPRAVPGDAGPGVAAGPSAHRNMAGAGEGPARVPGARSPG